MSVIRAELTMTPWCEDAFGESMCSNERWWVSFSFHSIGVQVCHFSSNFFWCTVHLPLKALRLSPRKGTFQVNQHLFWWYLLQDKALHFLNQCGFTHSYTKPHSSSEGLMQLLACDSISKKIELYNTFHRRQAWYCLQNVGLGTW